MWHKGIINNLRKYISETSEPELKSAINQIKDATLLPYLWEAGLTQELQNLCNKRSKLLAPKEPEGVK